jgi:uncharacterized OsmC-like protein
LICKRTTKVQQAENASVNLENGMYFVGDIDGFRVDTDADEAFGGAGGGPQPLRFLLLGIAGCMEMDVISILRKKRQRCERPKGGGAGVAGWTSTRRSTRR